MKWAEDLQDEVEKLIKQFAGLSQKVDAIVKESAGNSRQNADHARSMANYNSTAQSLLEESKRLKNEFPKTLPPSVRIHRIERLTLFSLLFLVGGLIAGYMLGPIAVNTYDVMKLEYKLKEREDQIEKFRNNGNEKTARKYFGD